MTIVEPHLSSATRTTQMRAARNNAVWCDTVCRAHGRAGEWRDGIWINRHDTPRFYPNAVTLSADPAPLDWVRTLIDAAIPGEWAIKDSFAALDLAPLGFRLLFAASWISRPASSPSPGAAIAGIRWGNVADASELTEWERAWNAANDGVQPPPARIFLPALLGDEAVAFIAAYRGERIVAGAIANRTGDVAGLSNLFALSVEGAAVRAGCVAQAIRTFPGLSLVGYERGNDVVTARSLGFETLGPLRVWVRVGESRSV